MSKQSKVKVERSKTHVFGYHGSHV